MVEGMGIEGPRQQNPRDRKDVRKSYAITISGRDRGILIVYHVRQQVQANPGFSKTSLYTCWLMPCLHWLETPGSEMKRNI
jgi:hypothetical protein